VRNLNVAVREWNDEVVFLHKIVEGAADKSYGIHVARLAGLPREVLERSKTLLARLEDAHLDGDGRPRMAAGRGQISSERQLSLFAAPEHPLLAEVRAVDIGQTTPLAALGLIETWQQAIADKTPTPAAPSAEPPVKRQRPPKPKHKPAAAPCASGVPSSDTAAM
jgi:DNA mismatch repair protein MutS